MAARKPIEDIPGTKPHTVYRLKNGDRVPGGSFVAKVAGSWQSEKFIVQWANRLGLDGYDSTKYRDKLADVGTVCHGIVENFFLGRDNDELFDLYPKWVVTQAKVCSKKFYEWTEHFDFDAVIIEKPFVSEIYKFGGTPDFFGRLRHKSNRPSCGDSCPLAGQDENTWKTFLLDWKTCKYLYKSHYYQVAGYNTLLFEHGYVSDFVGILRVGRNEKEGFQFSWRTSKEILLQWEIFRLALQMLTLQNGEPKWIK